ncbi:MAG TPA: hypothetical protein VD927_04345 [Chryseosolibacter sp.]|nr:hypothetical protein [Chryseosolibacter sp.]
MMARFLSYENQWKDVNELYAEFHLRLYSGGLPVPSNEEYSLDLKLRDLTSLGADTYYIEGKTMGVKLNQAILIDYRRDDHHIEFFHYFFAFRISRMQQGVIETFLHYHLNKSFLGDRKKYFRFLTLLIADHSDVIGERKSFLTEWMNDELRGLDVTSSLAAKQPLKDHLTKKKLINIDDTAIHTIVANFKSSFLDDAEKLHDALAGNDIEQKLRFSGTAKNLIAIFWVLYQNGLINNSTDEVASWIVRTFDSSQKQDRKTIALSTAQKFMGMGTMFLDNSNWCKRLNKAFPTIK